MTPKAPSKAPAPLFTLATLAERLGGLAEGDLGLVLSGAAGISEAGPGEVTFVGAARSLPAAASSGAGAFLLPGDLALPGRSVIRVANPRLAFAEALELFHPPAPPQPGVHAMSVVEPGAVIDPAASVSAFCFVGAGASIGARAALQPFAYVGAEAVIGEDCVIHPMAVVRERVRLGARVVVHPGAVIGGDGFGYVFDGRAHRKIPQVGTVEVGDDVEIGCGTTIDRATTGATRIGTGTKIDNLVQVGHNVTIGARAIIVSQVGISGSARIGDGAVLAGQVGVGDHAVVGERAVCTGRAGVIKHVPPGATVAGYGPQSLADFLRSQAVFDQLPQLRRRVAELEKRLAAAEAAAGIGKP